MKLNEIFFCIILAYCCVTPSENTFAQLSKADSSFYQSAISSAVYQYQVSEGDQSGLYNGAFYVEYPFHFKQGTPFFISSQLDTGSVLYDDILYKNILLQYDNLKDVVIANDNGYLIQLNNQKITEFTLTGHRFVRREKKDTSNSVVTTGFYEVLYNGNIIILKKTIKNIREDLSNGHDIERTIASSDYYFIQAKSAIYPIKNIKDLALILSDKKKEIQQWIKKNKPDFRMQKENVLLQIVAYYEQVRM
jgi:hypothetical protein